MSKLTNYVYSVSSVDKRTISVIWDGKTSEIAISNATHATVDEAYSGNLDGVSLAVYRAHYLAGKLEPKFARRSVEIAREITELGPYAAHKAWLNS